MCVGRRYNKNIKIKIKKNEKTNSWWNIAKIFTVNFRHEKTETSNLLFKQHSTSENLI